MNFISVRNGFINDGLFEYELRLWHQNGLNDIYQLEKLYMEAMKRRYCNRTINLSFNYASDPKIDSIYDELFNWIR